LLVSNKLGLGLISDRLGRTGRDIVLTIERLGIIRGIKVIDGTVVYPKHARFTNKMKARIADYIL